MTEWQFQPARDHGLTPLARLRSPAREPGLASRAVNLGWNACVRGYFAGYHRLAVTGREWLPSRPPFVLVANHCSHLDAPALSCAMPARLAGQVFSLAAGEVFFDNPARSGFAAMAVNALPLWRERTSAAEMALLRRRLVEDRIVLILFPEGTRSRTGLMARFRPGVGALVAGTGVPVVPCHLRGTHAAWPASRRLPRPGRIDLAIGPTLGFAQAAHDRAGWIEVAARCETAVRELGARWPVG